MKRTFTFNMCPKWINIIDVMLEVWKEGDLDRTKRDELRAEFHKMAKCTDRVMKQEKVGPYAED